jgi:hypothetical protein
VVVAAVTTLGANANFVILQQRRVSCRLGGDAPDFGRLKGARNGKKSHIR